MSSRLYRCDASNFFTRLALPHPWLARWRKSHAGGGSITVLQHEPLAGGTALAPHFPHDHLLHSFAIGILRLKFCHLFTAVAAYCEYSRRSRLLHAPQQGSRFPDFPPSPVHHQSSRPDNSNTESASAATTAMANLFRRIYDWLLRLFWYAYLSSSTSSNAPAWVPDAPFDTSHVSSSVHEKAKSWATITRDEC
jgi:hypothetical protein